MTIYSTRITVGTAATEMVSPSTMSQEASFLNVGTAIVRIGGGPDLTLEGWGLPILPNNQNTARNIFQTTIQPGDAIWGLVADGSATVNVWVVSKP